jgi:peptide deformylase
MKKDILICGEPVLRKKARPIREIDQEVTDLLESMVETMLEASGLGLAAPQVGEPLQALVARADDEEDTVIHRLLNPRLLSAEGEQCGREGCLSLPTLYGQVVRPERVTVRGVTPAGEETVIEAEGMLARAFLHEMDHLRGVLFTDLAPEESLVWLLPDATEEDGLRYEGTTLKEAQEAFERLRQRARRAR